MKPSPIRPLALAALAVLTCGPARAAAVHDCHGEEARAAAIAEPWEANTRTFANGAVRIAVLDTVEPAAAAFHLLVLSPPRDELGAPQCRVISSLAPEGRAASGFAGLSLKGMRSSYDPRVGLLLDIPAKLYNPASAQFDAARLRVTVNQSTGAIAAAEGGAR